MQLLQLMYLMQHRPAELQHQLQTKKLLKS